MFVIIGMVEYSRVAGSTLTGGTVLCPLARTVILCFILFQTRTHVLHTLIQRGGVRRLSGTPPLKNHKNIGFLSNTGPDPLKNHKTAKPAFNNGPPFKWRFTGGPMMTRNQWYLNPLIN